MKIDDLFCEDLFGAVIAHLRLCDKCRSGAKKVIDMPIVGLMLPADKKQSFVEALKQLEKESAK